MNTSTNNQSRSSDKASSESRSSNKASSETVYTLLPEDYYFARQDVIDCCNIYLLVLTCMIIGILWLFSYEAKKYFLYDVSNLTEFSSFANSSNMSSVQTV